ncbi:hypothetical protein ACFWPA_06025 [Rhodococcus sp. NPDC058505]|uniref:hypothetical protein n=1 Tax=Rhodococcus sp. NPDC058505 TaxID=3346531 RepID=UPI003647FD7D
MRKVPGGWVGAAVVLVLLVTFWALIVGTVLVGIAAWGTYKLVGIGLARRRDRLTGQRATASGLAARAQIQHEQYLAGDARGVYGEYQPVPLR